MLCRHRSHRGRDSEGVEAISRLARIIKAFSQLKKKHVMATIFTHIINGDIPGSFVWRDPHCVAFLSINPMAFGHTLVVPIEEIDHWVDAPTTLTQHLFEVTRIIGQAQREAFQPQRVGIIIAGYEVPHTHIHVVPTNTMAELSFASAATEISREELEHAAQALRSALSAAGHDQFVSTE